MHLLKTGLAFPLSAALMTACSRLPLPSPDVVNGYKAAGWQPNTILVYKKPVSFIADNTWEGGVLVLVGNNRDKQPCDTLRIVFAKYNGNDQEVYPIGGVETVRSKLDSNCYMTRRFDGQLLTTCVVCKSAEHLPPDTLSIMQTNVGYMTPSVLETFYPGNLRQYANPGVNILSDWAPWNVHNISHRAQHPHSLSNIAARKAVQRYRENLWQSAPALFTKKLLTP